MGPSLFSLQKKFCGDVVDHVTSPSPRNVSDVIDMACISQDDGSCETDTLVSEDDLGARNLDDDDDCPSDCP